MPRTPTLAARAAAALFLLLAAAARPAAAQFTNVAGPELADAGRAWGVVFTDLDGDGSPDLYFQNTALTPSRLFLHVAADSFVAAPAIPVAYTLDPTAADYDNDGDLDLFLHSPGLADHMLRNDGAGVFTDATVAPLNDAGQARCAGWADYDLDGDLDVYLGMGLTIGVNKLLRNDGARSFVDVTTPELAVEGGEGVAWGDVDGDGDPDLFLQRGGGMANVLLRNDGAAGFANVTAGALTDPGTSGRGAAWADWDNDGDLDMYLANEYGGSRLLRNDGTEFADVTGDSPALTFPGQAFACGWADYDNDGWLDLYVTTYSFAAPDKLFHNEGDGTFTDAAVPGMTDGTDTLAAAWADYDGDGDLDLYCADYETPNRLYRNDLANGNHWLQVDLVGTTTNHFGVGARILLAAGGMQQLREVGTDMGYMCQGSMTAEFGLGAATSVDAIGVQWPTGVFQVVEVAGVDQRITVVETSPGVGSPVVAAAGGDDELRLMPVAPNPFRGEAQVRFVMPGAGGAVRLTVHDVAGRCVAVLAEGVRGGGAQTVTWDGRALGGGRVPAGVYFVRLEAAGGVKGERVVLTR